MIHFKVLGKPQPAGSKKGFVHPKTNRVVIVDDAKHSRPWKQEVAGEAISILGACGRGMLQGPLELSCVFYFQRPKGHFGTGRNCELLKPSAPKHPAVKPDATKLVRAVEDAMTGIVYRDDAQIIRQTAVKAYGLPERVEITVRELRA